MRKLPELALGVAGCPGSTRKGKGAEARWHGGHKVIQII